MEALKQIMSGEQMRSLFNLETLGGGFALH